MSDLISRQAAIYAIREHKRNVLGEREWDEGIIFGYTAAHEHICDIIKTLPTIEERKKGWIPCRERMPEDLEEVNVTWVNHDPAPYYNFVKDKPFTGSAVYYKEKWYWYSSTCADILCEYGENDIDEVDDSIEIIAWMPLPKPYKGESDG